MVDKLRIDSHKLLFHPSRVSEWLVGKNIYPVTVEISPSGSCNHRCCFCAFDYLDYSPSFLKSEVIMPNLKEMSEKGVKAIVVCGEGEPLLNRETPEIINQARGFGLDVSLVSNGVLFSHEVAECCLKSLTWIRFSVNAGTIETYRKVHQGGLNDFNIALNNIKNAVEIKKKYGLQTTIGVQMLLIPENFQETLTLAHKLKEIGVDYFTVKPYSQHPKSNHSLDSSFNYQDHQQLESELNKLSTDDYSVIFRSKSMNKLVKNKSYTHCLGLPFWAYIDSKSNVWACLAHIGDPNFCFGNLGEATFVEMWEGERRAEQMKKFENMSITKCRELCRLDEINTYLHELKYPGGHVNFI